MAKVTGRIVATEHIYEGGAITQTRVFYDGTSLLLKGCFHFPQLATTEIKYEKQGEGEPVILKKVTLMSG